jgi:hypothetical protein
MKFYLKLNLKNEINKPFFLDKTAIFATINSAKNPAPISLK